MMNNSTNRLVKWSEDARIFFATAQENSITLDLMISYGCASQTGEGFEDLINSLNLTEIKNKLKRVNILDTSYLYRHVIPNFEQYADKSIPTLWFTKNKDFIDKLEINCTMKSWYDDINSEAFNFWYKKIRKDFEGDENGNGLVRDYRDLIIKTAGVFSYKGHGTYEGCIEFLLEECAHACAHLKNANIVYPVSLRGTPIMITMEKYNLNARQLSYRISSYSQNKNRSRIHNSDKIDKQVASFMKNDVSNLNFFVVDKDGNFIYKNYAFNKIIGDVNAEDLDPKSWKISKQVMLHRKQMIVEEEFEGIHYISMKAPLILDHEVEGVIGVSINITDRKRAEQLEIQNKLQEKIKNLAEQVAHDIRSPLLTLNALVQTYGNFTDKEHTTLKNIITSIENITGDLLCKYDEAGEEISYAEDDILVSSSLADIIHSKRYQYKDDKVNFRYLNDSKDPFIFIKGSFSDFSRMISNLVNNAVEALGPDKREVEIGFTLKNEYVEIYIKDTGKGISDENVNKLLNDLPIGTTKEKGYGIGLKQVKSSLHRMNGKMSVDVQKGQGTKISLSFLKSEPPKWAIRELSLSQGSTVVVLDEDHTIHDLWRERLATYQDKINVKYFVEGSEAINFINSFNSKRKIFLLTDYELRKQEINGIDVIEKCELEEQSVLVTSCYICKIKDFSKKMGIIKLLDKSLINHIPLVIKNNIQESLKVDMVFVDDDEYLSSSLAEYARHKNKVVHTYNSPQVFLEKLENYPKYTRIVVDHEFKANKLDGFALAEHLHKAGYKDLYMISGRKFDTYQIPPYLKVELKDFDSFSKLLLK